MTEDMRRKEIWEAITAGERALDSLNLARKELQSARNWGYLDIFGGGLLTTMVKHSRINNASHYLERAKTDLKAFQRELRDISDFESLDIEIGDFLTFADFFFDGLFADWMVQTKINDAENKVDVVIMRIYGLLGRLRAYD